MKHPDDSQKMMALLALSILLILITSLMHLFALALVTQAGLSFEVARVVGTFASFVALMGSALWVIMFLVAFACDANDDEENKK